MMMLTLAQSAVAEEGSKLLFYASVTMAAILFVGFIIILIARKKAEQQAQSFTPLTPFTLHDLRKMHQEGQLSDAEFERAKARMLAMSKREMAVESGAAEQPEGEIIIGREDRPQTDENTDENDDSPSAGSESGPNDRNG